MAGVLRATTPSIIDNAVKPTRRPRTANLKPTNHYRSLKNRRRFLNKTARKMRLFTIDDWYGVQSKNITDHGGRALLWLYSDSVTKMLHALYPEYAWSPWQSSCTPKEYWLSGRNLKEFVLEASETLNVKILSDWYAISTNQFIHIGGSGPLSRFGNSLSRLMHFIYPDYRWQPWRFDKAPQGHWCYQYNFLEFAKGAEEYLGLETIDDWYTVTTREIQQIGGWTIILIFGGSVANFIKYVYPDHQWNPLSFHRAARHYWNNDRTKQFFQSIEQSLQIQKPSDWYHISYKQLTQIGARGASNYFPWALQNVYPSFHWDFSVFRHKDKRTVQRQLRQGVVDLLRLRLGNQKLISQ